MSIVETIARLKGLAESNNAWALLRAETSPLILSCFRAMFADDVEVPVSRAKAVVEEHLSVWRDMGGEVGADASGYLRRWMHQGYIYELDQHYSLSDQAQIALTFAGSLTRRELGTTASHLMVVLNVVQDLSMALTGDVSARRRRLVAEQLRIEDELRLLDKGAPLELPSREQLREQAQEVVRQARTLTADFSLIREEIRQIDHQLRADMIEADGGRGAVLGGLLDNEDRLAASPAGKAFDAFFALLSDTARTEEFRAQLRTIADPKVGTVLPDADRIFLRSLMESLTTGSHRVAESRRRTWASLRAFVENKAYSENKALERLLDRLGRAAVRLKESPDFNPKAEMRVMLDTGSVKAASPYSLRIRHPSEEQDEGPPSVHSADEALDAHTLLRFRTLRVQAIATKLREHLRNHDALTLGALAALEPVTEGLEEVVARQRIAISVGGVHLDAEETIEFTERDGRRGRAVIPSIQISYEQFPADLSELDL
ncbi:MAG: DUF3375 family protein [Sinimarinibacterium flocculans]|uniref:DUF3375 family protein n=1 Tax=Sinimarinibacterium flocculans TaxID=985250 RepID=UPI003C6B6EC2